MKWKEVRLGEVCDAQNGYAFKSNDFIFNGDCNIIKIKELKAGKILFTEDSAKVLYRPEYEKYKVFENDVIFALTGDPINKPNQNSWVGRVSIYNHQEPALINQRVCKMQFSEKIDKKFFYYFFRQISVLTELASKAKGSASQANISTKDILDFAVPLPPLDIQRKISSILSSLDDKIETNNKLNSKLEEMAQAVFKEWFVDFGPFKNGKMVESEMGLIPEGWKVGKTGTIDMTVTDYVSNGSFASLKENVKLYEDEEYAYFIRNTDLKANSFKVYVDKHSYDFLSKSTLYGNEIIISNVGDVGSVHLCPKLDKPMTLGNNIIMLKPKMEYYTYFLYLWFKKFSGQTLIQGIKGGSAQPKFNKTDFKSLPIICPTIDLLQKYHNLVSPIFDQIRIISEESQRLSTLRDSLLPKLMKGEIEI